MPPTDEDAPADEASAEDPRAANLARWNELADLHPETDHYDVAGFLRGDSTLTGPEREALGSVAGESVVHLQCHVGLDTLSLAREGADVVGVDFASNALSTARRIRDEAGLDAEFVRADVADAPGALDRRFDVVFASYGAISWVADVEEWMAVAAALARPGGRLCLVEHHPVVASLDWELEPEGSYFRTGPRRRDEEGSYADPDADLEHTTYYTWHHRLGEVVTAAAGAGFRVEALREYPYLYVETFGDLERDGEGRYRLPGDPLPLVVGMTAEREAPA